MPTGALQKGKRRFAPTGALQRGGRYLCIQVPFIGEEDVCAYRCPSKGRRMFAPRSGGCLRLQVPFKGEDVCTYKCPSKGRRMFVPTGALQRGGGYVACRCPSKRRRKFALTGALQRRRGYLRLQAKGKWILHLQLPFKGEEDVCAYRCPSKGRRLGCI